MVEGGIERANARAVDVGVRLAGEGVSRRGRHRSPGVSPALYPVPSGGRRDSSRGVGTAEEHLAVVVKVLDGPSRPVSTTRPPGLTGQREETGARQERKANLPTTGRSLLVKLRRGRRSSFARVRSDEGVNGGSRDEGASPDQHTLQVAPRAHSPNGGAVDTE